MSLPPDYLERVYAGVLGKLVGVYLGRPFEGWSYEQIMAELGEIRGYVHTRRDVALRNHVLVVSDDDISGTFTFLRALEDSGFPRDIDPAQVGHAWLNYIVPGRTILWWGGVGNSTEHTAYLNLCDGVPAPESGSAARNGKVVAEQIGSQIFIDSWAMLAPGDPRRAADLAYRAASVSHDGEAIYGAQALAAMEALAFIEPSIERLLDAAVSVIPPDSVIARLYADVRAWHAADGDWRRTRERIVEGYGYHIYGGNCHMVPNHALILLGLLYSGDDFAQAMLIVNTSGWDTDCNAGNLACLLGIRGGMATFAGETDWLGPIADRLYLPTADGGRCISDATIEALAVANAGRRLAGLEPLSPKGGARFHFELPGSVQGFMADPAGAPLEVAGVAGHSRLGAHSLALRYGPLGPRQEARALTPTFILPGTPPMGSYEILASPTLYGGQTVRALVSADPDNGSPVTCALALSHYGPGDEPRSAVGPGLRLAPGESQAIMWETPDTGGQPIYEVGLTLRDSAAGGAVYLDAMTWGGVPDIRLTRPDGGGSMWLKAWVDACDHHWDHQWPEAFRVVQNRGRGMIIQGARAWDNYRVQADVTPHLAEAAGVAARVQGLRRYYALLLRRDGTIQLLKAHDGGEAVLAKASFAWDLGETYTLTLDADGDELRAWAAPGRATDLASPPIIHVRDGERPLLCGAVALVVEQGRTATEVVSIQPAR